ncbi:hypothetical protein CK203_086283 [Vitis vinifera]|uniref:Uncharacterized protein n=1 Tax=Vitis vinifera TaxID=29760 RepID=A0A438EDE7_VITVI|nr:hypothetical protein CK203_086283 [Vitis vinifera]
MVKSSANGGSRLQQAKKIQLRFLSCRIWLKLEYCERYRAQINKERINDFLAGLNKELDEVHGQLLGIKPLPVIEEIFVKVRREETHKRVMLGRDVTSGKRIGSAGEYGEIYHFKEDNTRMDKL